MKQNQFYSHINLIILILYLTVLSASVHTPIEDKENIDLTIHGKEWTYYELNDGLIYNDIGKQYDMGDSIQVSIYSRTVMASPDKKNKKFGFRVIINDNEPLQLKYKKEGSDATSLERSSWSYSKSGIWHFYLPVQETGYKINVEPLAKKPVIYLRLTSNKIKKKGEFTQVIKAVNHQDRIDIVTNKKKRKYYMLNGKNKQLFEIQGPAKIRAFSRMKFDDNREIDDYYIFVREDGIDLGTYYFQTEKSTESSVLDSKETVSKWRSLWLNIPDGKHYYTFSLSNLAENQGKTVFIRLKEWAEE